MASTKEVSSFSEAVIVNFNSDLIVLNTLIEVHLYTHNSTSNHSMRKKYRFAVYTFSDQQKSKSETIIEMFQTEFDNKIITKVYPFSKFKTLIETYQNYYQKNLSKPFCETFINPKFLLLLDKFSDYVNNRKVEHLKQAL